MDNLKKMEKDVSMPVDELQRACKAVNRGASVEGACGLAVEGSRGWLGFFVEERGWLVSWREERRGRHS